MKPPSAILAEDEPLVRVEIRDSLHALWPELTISAEVGDGVEALAAVERIAPDFVFLDIQMPGVNGLEVAQRISGRAHVVFISGLLPVSAAHTHLFKDSSRH
ncbi:MAG TPA: response regulator [Steroidobacteraceae bacterium]